VVRQDALSAVSQRSTIHLATGAGMSSLQFVASMIASLAWPVAIVLIIVLLRKQFLALLRRIVEVTLPGGYKIVFDTALEEGRASVEKSEASPLSFLPHVSKISIC
jgi:hypothetical protein